jgi:acetyl esterase/lipase
VQETEDYAERRHEARDGGVGSLANRLQPERLRGRPPLKRRGAMLATLPPWRARIMPAFTGSRRSVRPRGILWVVALVALATGCGVRVPFVPYYSRVELDPAVTDVRLDVRYRDDAGADAEKHRLDLFLPRGERWPMLAFVHGGSLEDGDTTKRVGGHDIYRNIGRFYSARGVGVALINYRLQPDVAWTDQVDDVAAATAWLVERATDLGSDGRLFLSGHSAGAWLAAHVALDDEVQRRHDFEPGKITGVISISGSGFDLTDEQTWEMFGRRKQWHRRFSVGPDDTAWQERASVVPLIDDPAPPFLLLYSTREWEALARQNRLFCAALESANRTCEIQPIDGPGHRAMVLALSSEGQSLARRVLEELGVASEPTASAAASSATNETECPPRRSTDESRLPNG